MVVDKALIERLLHQEEGPALDFKREQFPFEGAADDQKGECSRIYSPSPTVGGIPPPTSYWESTN